MVTSSFNLTRNGVKDWIIQRISAVILAVYSLFLFCFILAHPDINYKTWLVLFQHFWMKWFTLLAILSLIMHAWVGMWIIITDYIHCAYIRATLMVLFMLAFLFYLVWMIAILWG